MEWKKLGRVFSPEGTKWWARHSAMIPTPILLNDSVLRVFVTCCDENMIGRIGYVDLDSHCPTRVLGDSLEPVLDVGQDGTFDENGVLVCSITRAKNKELYLYYVGFELGKKIRYRLLTGLARQNKPDECFIRMKSVPILERSEQELFFRCGPFVRYEDGKFRMWYVAGSRWTTIKGKANPVYDIRYIESHDGVSWADQGKICISVENSTEYGFGRPYIVKDKNLYRMFYSIRRSDLNSYRLGYAESLDGINWTRQDKNLNFDVSKRGWDSTMICYSAVIQLHGKWFMFYNGNDFGRTGFGVAELVRW